MYSFNVITNNNEKNLTLKADLINYLTQHQFVFNSEHYVYLFIIGGDGTFLKHVKNFINQNIKIVFINSGRVGFFSYANSIEQILIEDLKKEDKFINLDLIKVNYLKNTYYCINEFALQSNYTIEASIYVNENLLNSYIGNGVLITTQFGSTARNKSINGALIAPNLNVFSIKEIEPIINKCSKPLTNPIIIKMDDKITIKAKFKNHWWILNDENENPFNNQNAVIKCEHFKSKCKILIDTNYANWFKKINDNL